MGGQTIQEIWAKSKAAFGSGVGEWGLFALITLAVLGSFGLGRLSALIDAKPLIHVQTAAAVEGQGMALGGSYVASRSGSVYYFPWCSGAASIAPQNQRWFNTAEEAKRAGYRPAKNCKGLE